MFKKIVYIEECMANDANVAEVLFKLSNPEIIYVPHYKTILNQTAADWRVQKKFQKIILAKRTEHFLYQGAIVTPNFGHAQFYYNTLALNCIYDCDYCYLQGMFNTPHLVLFLNQEDFMNPVKQLCDKTISPIYLALSYDTDLPALENIFPYCKTWIAFAKTQQNLIIEIRTKSVNIQTFLNLDPAENIILAWTLSPQEVIDYHEPLTPPLFSRLKAIRKVMDKGWNVRICIDPILKIPNYKIAYANMIKLMNDYLLLVNIHSFSLGVFRMNAEFLKRIKQQHRSSSVLYAPFEKNDEVVSYPELWKTEMTREIIHCLKKYIPYPSIEVL